MQVVGLHAPLVGLYGQLRLGATPADDPAAVEIEQLQLALHEGRGLRSGRTCSGTCPAPGGCHALPLAVHSALRVSPTWTKTGKSILILNQLPCPLRSSEAPVAPAGSSSGTDVPA